MFLLKRPSAADIRRVLARQADVAFSYEPVGRSRDGAPPGFTADRHRIRLGRGGAAFRRAVDAVRRWEMFNLGWVELCWPDAPIAIGTTVAVLVRAGGLWSLNACRIVYVVDEAGEDARFGFAYGTLPEHAEAGEERFTVEWRRADDTVWYDLFAFSQPRHPLARAARPVARSLQRRFARDSLQAMARAVEHGPA